MRSSLGYLGILAATSTFATTSLVNAADNETKPESYLFVQHADAAALADGTLALTGADGQVVVFSDRPHRATGTIPLAKLVEVWGEGADSFASDPPNAALIGQSGGKPVSMIVELQNPKLAADTITFTYTLLDGQQTASIDQPYMVIDSSWLDNTLGQLSESYNCTIGINAAACAQGAMPDGGTTTD